MTAHGKQDPTKAKILIVNDDPDIIEALAAVLRGEGYEVARMPIRDPNEVERIAPDLLMVDSAPGAEKETLNFLQLLRLRRVTAKIPIVLGASSMRHLEPDMLSGKRVHVLLRPFDVDELLAIVREMLHVKPRP